MRSRHPVTDLLSSRRAQRNRAAQLAAAHDHNPVGDLPDLVKIGREQQDGRTAIARAQQLAQDEIDRPNIKSASGVSGKDQFRCVGEFPGQHELLLIAAGKRAQRSARAARTDVIGADSLATLFASLLRPEPAARAQTSSSTGWSAASCRSSRMRRSRHCATDLPAHGPHQGPGEPPARGGRHGPNRQMVSQAAALRGAHAREQFDQFTLPVAVNTTERSDLPGPQLECRPATAGDTVRMSHLDAGRR